MFYRSDLLTKSGGEFNVIWLLAHGKSGKSKVAMANSINELKISEKCEALQRHLPEMSLYLLAVLQHGIVIAFSRKIDVVLKQLNETINKVFKPVVQKPAAKRRATDKEGGKGKRTRKTAAVLAPIDEEETLIDLSKLPTKGVSNRLRVSDIRQITLNEYDQPPQDFFEPDIRDLQNMVQMEDLDQGLENLRQVVNGSRAASIHEDLQSLYAELVNEMGFTMTELEPQRPNIDEIFNEILVPEFVGAEQPAEVPLDSSLQLPQLTESELREDIQAQHPRVEPQAAESRPSRRRRHVNQLIVDKEVELADNFMRQNIADFDDLVIERHPFVKKAKLPTAKELLDPVSVYLPTNHVLGNLLKKAAKSALENLKRRDEPPVDTEIAIEPIAEEPVVEVARRESIAMDALNEPLVEPDLTVQPMELDQSLVEPQPIEFEPQQQDVPFDVQQPLESQQNVAELNLNATVDQTMLPLENLEPELDHNAMTAMDKALFRRIKERQHGKRNIEFMEFANVTSRKAVARDFVNLLHLLKQRAVKVEQNVAYGPIFVEVTNC